MNKTEQSDVIEIDILELLSSLLRRWYLILLCTVVCGAIGLSISYFAITPLYESTTKIIVLRKGEGNISYTEMQLATQLTKDYEELITTRQVLEKVIEECNLREDYDELLKRIRVNNIADTRIISITVEDTSRVRAQQIASTICDVASEHIRNVTDVDAVNVADPANLPENPSSPSHKLWGLVSAAIGFLVMAVILGVQFLMDDSIKTEDDITKHLGLSTLAVIPLNDTTPSAQKKRSRHTTRRR